MIIIDHEIIHVSGRGPAGRQRDKQGQASGIEPVDRIIPIIIIIISGVLESP